MMNFLWTFQKHVTHLQPPLLLTLAAVTIAAGLFVWLGGLGFKKIMSVAVGLFFGAFCTLLYSSSNLLLAAALMGIFALLSFKLQETFLVLIASGVAALIGYSILIRPYFRPSSDIMAVIRQMTIGVPFYNWPILLAITALPFAALSWEGTSAVFASAAGAILLLAGTVMVLLNFGFEVVPHMTAKKELYYLMLVLAMVLGTFVQLWLLPQISTRLAVAKKAAKTKVKKVKTRKDDTEAAPKTTTWRTA